MRGEDGEERRLTASRILIAVGTRPARPSSVQFDVDAVFNYPTLAESYKVAALDAMNRVHAIRRLAA